MQENNKQQTKEEKKKNEYKVIRTFSKDGKTFQKVMEEILISKLNDM